MASCPVLLCKTFSQPYHDAFVERGFEPHFLQVLDTRFTNERELLQLIADGPQQADIGGVIVTSSRAAEAWTAAVQRIREMENDKSDSVSWKNIPFFVVGRATETALKNCVECSYAPNLIHGAEHTGSGEALAQYIIVNHKPASDSDLEHRQLLYLTGDKNRETIPEILGDGGFSLRRLQVYETAAVDDLMKRSVEKMEALTASSQETPWVVFFSPSTAEAVLDAIPDSRCASTESDSLSFRNSSLRLASIGSTTREYLMSRGLAVDASSGKPSADSLSQAISEARLVT